MPNENAIKRYYLSRLAEYRKAGYSDDAAARAAAADTKAKYGRIPRGH